MTDVRGRRGPAAICSTEHRGLLDTANPRIERIVSMGQASPPGFWYVQPWAEWVVVLARLAGLSFEGEAEVKVLSPGDQVLIPARVKHCVEWTGKDHATIWIAVHYKFEPCKSAA